MVPRRPCYGETRKKMNSSGLSIRRHGLGIALTICSRAAPLRDPPHPPGPVRFGARCSPPENSQSSAWLAGRADSHPCVVIVQVGRQWKGQIGGDCSKTLLGRDGEAGLHKASDEVSKARDGLATVLIQKRRFSFGVIDKPRRPCEERTRAPSRHALICHEVKYITVFVFSL